MLCDCTKKSVKLSSPNETNTDDPDVNYLLGWKCPLFTLIFLWAVVMSLLMSFCVYQLLENAKIDNQSLQHDGKKHGTLGDLSSLLSEMRDVCSKGCANTTPVLQPSGSNSNTSFADIEKDIRLHRLEEWVQSQWNDLSKKVDSLTDKVESSNGTSSSPVVLDQETIKDLKSLRDTVTSNLERITKFERGQIDSLYASKVLPLTGINRVNLYFEERGLVPLQIKLIFRASEFGFQAAAFHNYCDNKGPSLVLIKSKPEGSDRTGQVFGGFTTGEWSSPVQTQAQRGSKNDFLFSLEWNDELPIDTKYAYLVDNAIWSGLHMGPQFGSNPEIKIGNECNSLRNSVSDLGSQSRIFIEPSGAKSFVHTDDKMFLCEEYEVYSVLL